MSTSASPGDAMESRQRLSETDSSRGSRRQAFLFIRVWIASQAAADNSSLSWQAENSLIQMITDLVSASGGSAAGKRRNGLIARFPNTSDAAAAATHLQQAIAGFAARSQPPPLAAFVVFAEDMDPSGLDESSDELETASVLAGAAQPAQILLTAAAYAELRLSAPYTSRSAALFRMPSGVYSNLKAYQLSWNTSPLPLSNHSPTETKAPAKRTEQRDRATQETASERSPTLAGMSTQPGPYLPAEPAPVPQTEPLNPTLMIGSQSSSTDIIPSEHPEPASNASRRRTPLYVGLGAMTVAIFAAGTWFFMQPPRTSPGSSASEMTKQPTSAASQPDSTPAPAVPSEPTSGNPNPSTAGGETPSKAPGAVASPLPKRTPPGKNLSEKGSANANGFFPSDIPWLLTRADRESGDGEYDAAERDYKIVLKLDPGNGAARKGLGRNAARRSEEEQ